MLGDEYVRAVCSAHRVLVDTADDTLDALTHAKVDFYPKSFQAHLTGLLNKVGTCVVEPSLCNTSDGAGSAKFCEATKTAAAPLSGGGYYRIGEDGQLYLISKSEHYHAPLGHSFPGYHLLDKARALGIPNATHNNTRGHITRLLERELIRTANGLKRDDDAALGRVLDRTGDMRALNRVLNLETGSLAVEAALKMILARFYRIEPHMPTPTYAGRTPVILVMGNEDGGLQANYHGTTILTQMMRGMWPGFHKKLENNNLWKVVPIRPNCIEDLDNAFASYEKGPFKIAGFFHEIIMMNYGARRLTPAFLEHAYKLCETHDVPTVADEIQTCMWSSELYLFRECGLHPTFVAIGKGFPGGQYPASRLLFSAAMDALPQFGALVTNGQEELASLAYLVTMEWAQANSAITSAVGAYYETRLGELAARYPHVINDIDGWHHMTSLRFGDLRQATTFTTELGDRGLDVSAQTYKADCPPVVLTKLPLIADRPVVDFVVECMKQTLARMV
ncbi:MAG: aminotransferase class III-fold pyridoxal phosphate-dependent enzyme [Candidatus Pacebacteria bacterium]|nr:aminotransferase class III-fold pyridoxal phosphate-dependent enzyme [Candidatus Paceibacterota bacterium]